MGGRRATLAAFGVGLVTTLVLVTVPSINFAYRRPALRVSMETAVALIAGLVAFLAFGRFRQRRLLNDFGIGYALALFACTNLFFVAIPNAVVGDGADRFATWGPVFARTLGSAVLAASALAPRRRVGTLRPTVVAAAVVIPIAVVVLLSVVLSGHLPRPVEFTPPVTASTHPTFSAVLIVPISQVVIGLLFLVAATAFVRRGERENDEFWAWLAAGCALNVFARANYVLFPSLYSEWFYTADILRLGGYTLWLVGAGREMASYWSTRAALAVEEERRRMARDLHDGLAHELAFIASYADLAADGPLPDDMLPRLGSAARRALDESRRAITALTAPPGESLDAAVAQAAEDVAARAGVAVRLSLEHGVDVPGPTREALVRIVREAVTNATRHGCASTVHVVLSASDALRLLVRDDGTGFDPDQEARPFAFGVTSMRERAAAIGGRFEIRSAPGKGAEVEVVVGG